MDWTHVNTLILDSADKDSIQKLQPVLKSLSSLSINYAGYCDAPAWHELLNNKTSPLISLSFKNVRRESFDPTVEILVSRHGPTLTYLCLGEWEGFREGQSEDFNGSKVIHFEPHVYLTPTHLARLTKGCPNLAHLDIDVNRTSPTTLDNAVLNIIPNFSKLASLVLRLESPDMQHRRANPEERKARCNMHTAGSDRIINATSVIALFHNLRQQQQDRLQANMPLLNSLEVVVGNWDQRHQYGMRGPPRHLLGNWHCRVDADEREVCEGKNTWPDYWTRGGSMYTIEDNDDNDVVEIIEDF